ncbi:MAG: M56 family metallopeptidase [Planctomycetota bacterium]|jgi:bla regulator protein BlaR1
MDALAIHASTFLDWLLRTTGQASLLICLVLLAQRLLRRQLGVRARYLLWLVVVARMALPWAPQSGLSVYNLVPGASMV